mmetsp:Transcript_81007/g.225050  ORF Transcript_81007/g.225050 Transcript_81007/m.225050 type:complete len:86 (-) Transcript_81007:322-579(-)
MAQGALHHLCVPLAESVEATKREAAKEAASSTALSDAVPNGLHLRPTTSFSKRMSISVFASMPQNCMQFSSSRLLSTSKNSPSEC